jgi:hypothetical protein
MNREDYENYQAQGAIQQQQAEQQQSAYAPQMFEQMQQSQAILVETTNPSKIVDTIMLRLRGLKRMPDGTEIKIAKAKVNEIGYEKIWFLLDSHINQNIILSHLEEQNVSNIITTLGEDLVDMLSLNWKEWGITDKNDLDAINNCILVNIFMALKRAEGQNEKNWLGKISLEHISGMPRLPQMKKDSFWSKFRL